MCWVLGKSLLKVLAADVPQKFIVGRVHVALKSRLMMVCEGAWQTHWGREEWDEFGNRVESKRWGEISAGEAKTC